ncbi:MAG: SufE family protein [Gammaproteobacteria bacterium]|jgi:cysteine desulfuration protein SufE|nr:SufE family protein [Gammaproteobacteria bacterium]MBT3694711.1 SufE family protein [Gammaproteobacteria bacterium]MBT5334167.1 SufE family protein [Gammaproteobacteria bacterium]MBT5681294.1 SufE family protein [Gammaproteobacteria bacterium]MBT6024762.1 SufE family protein [Gammaproteobacteria bacterium]
MAVSMDLEELKETFSFFDDWEDKYRFIIDLGKDLTPLADAEKTEANLIRGCQSQVWLTHQLSDGKLHFQLDSDAHIVRGLGAVVLIASNDQSPEQITALDLDGLFDELDLLAHLSVTRGNGLRSMIEKIKHIAAHS